MLGRNYRATIFLLAVVDPTRFSPLRLERLAICLLRLVLLASQSDGLRCLKLRRPHDRFVRSKGRNLRGHRDKLAPPFHDRLLYSICSPSVPFRFHD